MTRARFLELLLGCDGAILGHSQWESSRPAIWRDGREIAHWQGSKFVDLRLRKATLLKAGVPAIAIADPRRDWTTVDVKHVDAQLAAKLVETFDADARRTKSKRR